MRIRKIFGLFLFCVLHACLALNVFGAETITLTCEPSNAVLRGEFVSYELKQEALEDPTLPLYIRITFTDGLTVQNDSITYRTNAGDGLSEPLTFSNREIVYGSNGFTILLNAPVETTTISFKAEVEKIATGSVSCTASILSTNESIQVTQKLHDLQFADVSLDSASDSTTIGKVTASALEKNEVRPINYKRIFFYFFLVAVAVLLILFIIGIYLRSKNKKIADTEVLDVSDGATQEVDESHE